MNFNGTSFEYQTNIQQNAPFRFGKQNFANNDFNQQHMFNQQQQMQPIMNAAGNFMPNSNNNFANKKFNNKRKADSSFTCTICSIEVGSQDVLTSHMNGQKHAKRLRQINVTTNANAVIKAPTTNVTTTQVVSTNAATVQTQASAVAVATPINNANSNVTPTMMAFNSGQNLAPTVKLHLQQLNDLASFHQLKVKYEVVGETGPQHAKQFEVKCIVYDPKTNVESECYKTGSTSISKAKQAVAEIALQNTKLEKPTAEQVKNKRIAKNPRSPFKREKKVRQQGEEANVTNTNTNKQNRPKNNRNNNNNNSPNNSFKQNSFPEIETQRHNKRFLLAKHIQIQPDKEQMSLITQLISGIEQSLKSVSDKLMKEELNNMGLPAEGNSDEVVQQARKLRGVFRVGPLEKGLLLKTDRELNLIALTADIPTYTFVSRVLNEFAQSDLFLKASTLEGEPLAYQLNKSALKLVRDESLIKTEACAYIAYEYKQPEADFYRIKLSFTSTKLDHDLSQINLLNCSKDSLPVEKCLESIDEIRRTKWFSVKLKPIANALLVLRVMRDFCRRTPTWFVLNDWLLELIVDKCFVRNKYEKVPLKFRTIFEAISSGMFFLRSLMIGNVTSATGETTTESVDLVDPCKKDSTASVFDSLTLQQKEDLTSSAQHALRLIAFKRINQVLALDAAEADLLFSSTTSSDKFISRKNEQANKKQQSDSVATDLDTKLNLLPHTNALAPTTTTPTTITATTGGAAPNATPAVNFDFETSQNFNENINNISMFILNNYASNIFDLCFSFLDLANLKN